MSKGFFFIMLGELAALIGFGILMGLAFAAPPGIVTAETLRRGMMHGFPAALSVQLGSLIGDAAYCLLALAGVTVLVQHPFTQRVLGLMSIAFLLYLAVSGIYAELKSTAKPALDQPVFRANSRGSALLSGMFLSLTNPWAIGFWLSLGSMLASYGAMKSNHTMALFFLSFFGACLAYAVLIALLIGATRRALPRQYGKAISIACSVLIGLLGIPLAYQMLDLFFQG